MVEFSLIEIVLIATDLVLAYLLSRAMQTTASYRDRAWKAERMILLVMTNMDAREKLVESFNATFGDKNASTD